MRHIGYKPIGTSPEGQLNCVRPLGADYPRFHAYVKVLTLTNSASESQGFEFNLHLDQKRPSYEGATAHSGEYDGPTVLAEKERIVKISQPSDSPPPIKPFWE